MGHEGQSHELCYAKSLWSHRLEFTAKFSRWCCSQPTAVWAKYHLVGNELMFKSFEIINFEIHFEMRARLHFLLQPSCERKRKKRQGKTLSETLERKWQLMRIGLLEKPSRALDLNARLSRVVTVTTMAASQLLQFMCINVLSFLLSLFLASCL